MSMKMIAIRTATAVAMALGAAGCATGTVGARAILPQAPAELGRCHVAASQTSPLVTEWPASEKANLEVMLHGGAVAVAYGGCSMRLLPQCRVRGAYRWQRTTPSTDSLEINDADELYAKLPLGAASLEGELKRSGKLTVKTVVSGQLRLDGASTADVPGDEACAQATHIISALSIGAFALSADGARKGSVGAGISLGEAKLSTDRSAGLLRSAGDFEACSSATDDSPHGNCASPVQVFLAPLPGRAGDEGPPGTVKVDFVSGDPSSRWDVYSDDQVICTTPCARFVQPAHPVLLRARDGAYGMSADKVAVPNLLDQAALGHLQLRAEPTARGELASGIVLTTFSGMAVLTGVTLASIGCFGGHSGFCTAGSITLGVGGAALAGSIWLIVDAQPRAELGPTEPAPMMLARRPRRLLIGPTGVAGVF